MGHRRNWTEEVPGVREDLQAGRWVARFSHDQLTEVLPPRTIRSSNGAPGELGPPLSPDLLGTLLNHQPDNRGLVVTPDTLGRPFETREQSGRVKGLINATQAGPTRNAPGQRRLITGRHVRRDRLGLNKPPPDFTIRDRAGSSALSGANNEVVEPALCLEELRNGQR